MHGRHPDLSVCVLSVHCFSGSVARGREHGHPRGAPPTPVLTAPLSHLPRTASHRWLPLGSRHRPSPYMPAPLGFVPSAAHPGLAAEARTPIPPLLLPPPPLRHQTQPVLPLVSLESTPGSPCLRYHPSTGSCHLWPRHGGSRRPLYFTSPVTCSLRTAENDLGRWQSWARPPQNPATAILCPRDRPRGLYLPFQASPVLLHPHLCIHTCTHIYTYAHTHRHAQTLSTIGHTGLLFLWFSTHKSSPLRAQLPHHKTASILSTVASRSTRMALWPNTGCRACVPGLLC